MGDISSPESRKQCKKRSEEKLKKKRWQKGSPLFRSICQTSLYLLDHMFSTKKIIFPHIVSQPTAIGAGYTLMVILKKENFGILLIVLCTPDTCGTVIEQYYSRILFFSMQIMRKGFVLGFTLSPRFICTGTNCNVAFLATQNLNKL